jgi:hypothetical protein
MSVSAEILDFFEFAGVQIRKDSASLRVVLDADGTPIRYCGTEKYVDRTTRSIPRSEFMNYLAKDSDSGEADEERLEDFKRKIYAEFDRAGYYLLEAPDGALCYFI